MHQLNDQYQVNVWGEGGEFETVVLDWPLFVDHKISVDEYKIIDVSDDEYAPVWHVYMNKLSLIEKDPDENAIQIYQQEETKFDLENSLLESENHAIFNLTEEESKYESPMLYKNQYYFSTRLLCLKDFDVSSNNIEISL